MYIITNHHNITKAVNNLEEAMKAKIQLEKIFDCQFFMQCYKDKWDVNFLH